MSPVPYQILPVLPTLPPDFARPINPILSQWEPRPGGKKKLLALLLK